LGEGLHKVLKRQVREFACARGRLREPIDAGELVITASFGHHLTTLPWKLVELATSQG
jgi:hypothetical protein